jgi:hypothetical protein
VRRIARRALLAALVIALPAFAGLSAVARAEGAGGTAPPGTVQITGRWNGAKLRCQKEEGKLLRCGTPAPFAIAFDGAGTGTTPDESLPRTFSWRWLSDREIGITPTGGGEETKLFAVERDGDMLTFQAYVFLPTVDPNAPVEARYIHFVFDVNLAE